MRKIAKIVGRVALVAVVAAAVAALVVVVDPVHNINSSAVSSTTTTTADTGTTSTSTSTTSTTAPPAGGLIIAGPSRSECLTPNIAQGVYGLAHVLSAVASFDAVTGTNVTCISAYLNSAQSWAQWVNPWITNPIYGYSTWVSQEPENRELILAVSPIPTSVADPTNPLGWETMCATGKFDGYAREMGENLVGAGLQNSVLRIGPEMNGKWEPYFMGKTTEEQHLWVSCFDNEVTALRQAPGEHFLIDWNPNACKGYFPYSNFYPGNAYVDIVGLDLYDVGCLAPTRRLNFTQLAAEREGLDHFEDFAAAQGKPMSLPEWGLSTIPAGDDPGYIDGIGATVARGNFAFESYFDVTAPKSKALPLGPRTPLSVTAFKEWFGADS